MNDNQIAEFSGGVRQIHDMLETNPQDWQGYLASARDILSSIDATHFMQSVTRTEEQVWLVGCLQRLAYMEPDAGGVRDIAEWCLRQWLTILESRPQNVGALTGAGHNWLLKAQPALARIHAQDGSSSSSSGASVRVAAFASSLTAGEDEDNQSSQTERDAVHRMHNPDYVEARGILLPAVDFLSQAVNAADVQGVLNGDLLAMAAEANMSLGNTTYPRTNEQYYRQAINYLRRAASIPGFSLPVHLQRYLDEFGRLVG